METLVPKSHFELSRAAIKGGSRSFRLASLILDQSSKEGAYLLYHWCRYCDDRIDESSSPSEAESRLRELHWQTGRALSGDYTVENPAFAGLHQLVVNYRIPYRYFFELLEGFRRDVAGEPIETLDQLLSYCYHVAGVVGLMMSHILGTRDLQALEYADSLGRAMQLTNIARDIKDDFLAQRLYLPRSWLRNKNIDPRYVMDPTRQEALFTIVRELLILADDLYERGRLGLNYLPFRAAWSISVASALYQGIGHEIIAKGPSALESRMILKPYQKFYYFLRGTFDFFGRRFQHLKNRIFYRKDLP